MGHLRLLLLFEVRLLKVGEPQDLLEHILVLHCSLVTVLIIAYLWVNFKSVLSSTNVGTKMTLSNADRDVYD